MHLSSTRWNTLKPESSRTWPGQYDPGRKVTDFDRYRCLATNTVYRLPGGLQTAQSVQERWIRNNARIRRLAEKPGGFIHFPITPKSSLAIRLYSFSAVGRKPLLLQRPRALTAGRRLKRFALRAMTATESQRKKSGGNAARPAPNGRTQRLVSS